MYSFSYNYSAKVTKYYEILQKLLLKFVNTLQNITEYNMFDLKAFRKDFKMSQGEMKDFLGCTQSYISLVENGNRELTEQYVDKIRAKYGNDVAEYYSSCNIKEKYDNDITDDESEPKICSNEIVLSLIEEIAAHREQVQYTIELVKKLVEYVTKIK